MTTQLPAQFPIDRLKIETNDEDWYKQLVSKGPHEPTEILGRQWLLHEWYHSRRKYSGPFFCGTIHFIRVIEVSDGAR